MAWGDLGARTDQGLLIQIDQRSSSPFETTYLTPQPQSGPGNDTIPERNYLFSKDLYPGKHTISCTLQADGLSLNFNGFAVRSNASVGQ